jgi:invasion protein IalB
MQIAERTTALLQAAVLLMTLAGRASAQQPPRSSPAPSPTPPAVQVPRSAAQDEAPQRTTATYEDWIVQCEMQNGPTPEKVCDMAQMTQMQGKNIPFSRVAIARPVKGQPIKLFVQLPVNVSFRTNVRIQTSDSDAGVVAPFARCLPAGCFADFEIKEEVVKKLRAASGAGKLSFADAAGREVAIPLSFKGFSQALDALGKE